MEIDCECTLLNDAQIYLYLSATYTRNNYIILIYIIYIMSFLIQSLI